MGKSYKDKANFYRNHPEIKAPDSLKGLINLMDQHGKGDRSGNQRKALAQIKVVERRNERARAKQQLQYSVKQGFK